MKSFRPVLFLAIAPLALAAGLHFANAAGAQTSPSSSCPVVDGKLDDWAGKKPLIVDPPDKLEIPASDIRQVFGETCDGWLYLAYVVDGPAGASSAVSFDLMVDSNGDFRPDWQPGFSSAAAWLWNLKGAGYADQKNMRMLKAGEFKLAVGQIAEFAMPLKLLDDAARPNIRVYTYIESRGAPRVANIDSGAWTEVPPIGGSVAPEGPRTYPWYTGINSLLLRNRPATIVGAVGAGVILILTAVIIILARKLARLKKH